MADINMIFIKFFAFLIVLSQTCSGDLQDSCYEILEVYQMRWTIENYYNASLGSSGSIESGSFPTTGYHDSTFQHGIYRDGDDNNKGKFTIRYWHENPVRTDDNKQNIYILDPNFDRNGEYFQAVAGDHRYTVQGTTGTDTYAVFPSADIKKYLSKTQTLEIFIEVFRIRVLPECVTIFFVDNGRGTVLPKPEPDVTATHCTILLSGTKKCLPMDPYYGFTMKKLAPSKAKGQAGGIAGGCPTQFDDLKKENEKLKEKLEQCEKEKEAMGKLLKIKEEENARLKENSLL